MAFDLAQYTNRVAQMDCAVYEGEVERVTGSMIEARGPSVGVGQLCEIRPRHGGLWRMKAEVIAFRGSTTILMPLQKLNGIQAGDRVVSVSGQLGVALSEKLLGRVLDGLGRPVDDGPKVPCSHRSPIHKAAPHPLKRRHITEPLHTGIRAIDGPLTLGKGQRVGIFAGSGVGKSTLLGQIARSSQAEANVIALAGERGREVGQFIRDNLGPTGLKKSVVVVATADAPPLLKVKATFTATTIAEYLRDRGMDVLFMMDSLTRVANAQREIGLAAGEPPTINGYPPSVFSLIPSLTERLGNSSDGSITGIYTVLVERDDFNDPVADATRASLDGHIVLSRTLADRGHYPAVDVLGSVSRTMPDIVEDDHLSTVRRLKAILSTYGETEDLIKIGAYNKGGSPLIDAAVDLMPGVNALLRQGIREEDSFEATLQKMQAITQQWQF